MLTVRNAQSAFQYWSNRSYDLDKATYAILLKGDPVDLNLHLEQLKIARVSKLRALEELQTIRGRVPAKPVRLGSVKLIQTPHRRSIPSRVTAHSSLTLKSINSERREIAGWATTPELDHVGDIVEPRGAEFVLPIKLLHQHDHTKPVGHVVDADVSDAGIQIKATIVKVEEPGPLKDRVDTAWAEIRHGLVNNLSIGFKPIEWSYLEDKSGGIRYTRWKFLELSLVTIPAQPRARITVAA